MDRDRADSGRRANGPNRPEAESRKRRLPRQITPAYLDRAAASYLERYASSVENLRRLLTRKVERRCRLRSEDPAEFSTLVENAVHRAMQSGLLDDRRYAEGRLATLRRRGASSRLIEARLGGKGVDRQAIAVALKPDQEGTRDAECEAAWALARRRRLGPFRTGERGFHREKDLAALARAGFRFELARQVIDGEPPDMT
jgi:regulatory protein